MADARRNLTHPKPYTARPCPDPGDASVREVLYWEHGERLEARIRAAIHDHGHTAVAAMLNHQVRTRERYTAAREARLAEALTRATRGTLLDQIVAAVSSCPVAMQDEIVARLGELVQARG